MIAPFVITEAMWPAGFRHPGVLRVGARVASLLLLAAGSCGGRLTLAAA